MNIKILDKQISPQTTEECLNFLMSLIPEEFFPNSRIARRVLSKTTDYEQIKTYFLNMLSQNNVFIVQNNKTLLLLGVLKPMKFESSVFGKNMYTLKIYENMAKNPSMNEKLEFMRKIIAFSLKAGIDHISCKLDTGKYSTINALEKTGFLLVSTLISYYVHA